MPISDDGNVGTRRAGDTITCRDGLRRFIS